MTRSSLHDPIAVPLSPTRRQWFAVLDREVPSLHVPAVARTRGDTAEAVRRAMDARAVYGADDSRAQSAAIDCAEVGERQLAALIADAMRDGMMDPEAIAARLVRFGVKVRP